MDNSIESTDRLWKESSRLVNIGYWNTPSNDSASKDMSEAIQMKIWTMKAISEARPGFTPEAAVASEFVSRDLARSLAVDMKDAIEMKRLNPAAVVDKEVIGYPRALGEGDVPQRHSIPSVKRTQIALTDRVGKSVADATSLMGSWRSSVSLDDAGKTLPDPSATARAGARGVEFLLSHAGKLPRSHGAPTPDMKAAYEVAAVGLAVDLVKQVRSALGRGELPMSALKSPALYTETGEKQLLGVSRAPASTTKGPTQPDMDVAAVVNARTGGASR
jgi:hypothetical protein